MSDSESKKGTRARVVRSFDYYGPQRENCFQVCVKSDGSRCMRTRDPVNPRNWVWGLTAGGAKNTLYDYKTVASAASRHVPVFVCPDEDGVEALKVLKLAATTCGGGYGRWSLDLCELMKGVRQAVIIVGNDPGADKVDPGEPFWVNQKQGVGVLRCFEAAGVPAMVFVLPDVNGEPCRDVSLWAAQFADYQSLVREIQAAPPFPQKFFKSLAILEAPKVKSLQKVSKYEVDPDKELWKLIDIELARAAVGEDGKARRLSSGEMRKIQSDIMFEWLKARGSLFYHMEARRHDASMYFDRTEKELHLMNSDLFASWLACSSGLNRTDKSFSHCFSDLCDRTLVGEDSQGVIPSNFFHRCADVIYVSNGDRHIVRVAADGVKMVDNGTDGVIFSAGSTLSEWVLVDEDGEVNPFEECILFSTMEAVDKHVGPLLVMLWVLGVFACPEKKPPLVLAGTVGSGKTRVAEGVFELLGMNKRINKIKDNSKAEEDFWVSINRHGVMCIDNVDTSVRWLPDALAMAATNGFVEVRKQYTDGDVYTHRANANLMITSANPYFAGDAGFADRVLPVRLDRVQKKTKDSFLTKDIDLKRNAGLSWMCRVLSRALADKGEVPDNLNRRHPDWSEFAVRCGRALNREEEVIKAIRFAEEDKSRFAVEYNWIGALLKDVLPPGKEWSGTSTELCELISLNSDLSEKQRKDLSPRRIGKQLAQIWPHLETVFKASKKISTGKTIYTLVGLVGLVGSIQETSDKTIITNFVKTDPPNPPNPPITQDVEKKEKTSFLLEDIELMESFGVDGWED